MIKIGTSCPSFDLAEGEKDLGLCGPLVPATGLLSLSFPLPLSIFLSLVLPLFYSFGYLGAFVTL